jgi:predicted RNA-binding protein with EMAP domain
MDPYRRPTPELDHPDEEVKPMRPRNKILQDTAGHPNHVMIEVLLDVRDHLADVKTHLAQIQARQDKTLEKLDEIYHELPPRSDADDAIKAIKQLAGEVSSELEGPRALDVFCSALLRETPHEN